MYLLVSALFLIGTVPASDATQDIMRLEQRLTDALVHADVGTIDGLWSDDLIFVGTDGKSSTKRERLSRMKSDTGSSVIVTTATNDDVKVRVYGDTAVVTLLATWTTRTNNRDFSDRYMTTHLWVKQRGRWQLVSAQVSRVAR